MALSVSAPLRIAAVIALMTGPVLAQGLPGGGFKHDSTQPIEVSADSLEVRQEAQTAVFSGNVKARQGNVWMQASEIVVSYDTENEVSGPTGSDTPIRAVRAEGEVFISNGTETAQGDWADYDVAAGEILLGGEVFLTQNESALRGTRLRINLNTGQARMEGRVEGIFTPTRN